MHCGVRIIYALSVESRHLGRNFCARLALPLVTGPACQKKSFQTAVPPIPSRASCARCASRMKVPVGRITQWSVTASGESMLADEEVFASNCKTHSCARISTYLATLSFYPSLKTTGRHLEKRAKERILRYVTGFRAKREYRVTIKCVIFVQAVARGHMCRRDFLRWKRNSKRPFSLRLQAGKCMSAVGVGQETRAIVLITDRSMRRQLHRFDSNPVSYSNRDRGPHGRRCADGAYWNEEFLVPALSSTSALKSPISQPLLSSFRLDLFSGRKK